MSKMKIIVRLGVLEAAALFTAGFFVGKYMESKNYIPVEDEPAPDVKRKKKKKSVRYEDGQLIFDIKGRSC